MLQMYFLSNKGEKQKIVRFFPHYRESTVIKMFNSNQEIIQDQNKKNN